MIHYFLPLLMVSAHLLLWIWESPSCSSGCILQFSDFFQSLLSLNAPKLGVSLNCEVLNNSIPCLYISSLFFFTFWSIYLILLASLPLCSFLYSNINCTYLPTHFSASNSISEFFQDVCQCAFLLLEKQVDSACEIKMSLNVWEAHKAHRIMRV